MLLLPGLRAGAGRGGGGDLVTPETIQELRDELLRIKKELPLAQKAQKEADNKLAKLWERQRAIECVLADAGPEPEEGVIS